jgi:5-methylcytosine-specific restriction endonuclease McrA
MSTATKRTHTTAFLEEEELPQMEGARILLSMDMDTLGLKLITEVRESWVVNPALAIDETTGKKKLSPYRSALIRTQKCAHCGTEGEDADLQLHHRDPWSKVANVCSLAAVFKMDSPPIPQPMIDYCMRREWRKCIVLCRPCHRAETTKQWKEKTLWQGIGPLRTMLQQSYALALLNGRGDTAAAAHLHRRLPHFFAFDLGLSVEHGFWRNDYVPPSRTRKRTVAAHDGDRDCDCDTTKPFRLF